MTQDPGDPGVFTPGEVAAMRRALTLAETAGVPRGPNPRVGCVLIDTEGVPAAEGYHRGAGTPHAETDALKALGRAATGFTAVVTLEPCNHTGRTGPCAQALVEAGVSRVVYAQADLNPLATGGGTTLARAGVDVAGGLLLDDARAVNREWTFSLEQGRPFVTWKFATSLDGHSAASDGTSRWVSNEAARRDTHLRRSECDVVLAGTGTVLIDDPHLTVRDEEDQPLPRDHQPLRAVMGLRDIPSDRRVLDDHAETVRLVTRDPHEALAALVARDRKHVFLEGGPRLAGVFLKAGLVDEVVAYVAPLLLGGGRHAVEGLDIDTIAEAAHLRVLAIDAVGIGADRNVRLVLTPTTHAAPKEG